MASQRVTPSLVRRMKALVEKGTPWPDVASKFKLSTYQSRHWRKKIEIELARHEEATVEDVQEELDGTPETTKLTDEEMMMPEEEETQDDDYVCGACGHKLRGPERFCSKCGVELSWE